MKIKSFDPPLQKRWIKINVLQRRTALSSPRPNKPGVIFDPVLALERLFIKEKMNLCRNVL